MSVTEAAAAAVWDAAKIREDFPILARSVRGGRRLVYLDSAATSQKPRVVLDAERAYYETANAAVHRGAHQLAEEATEAYEGARARIASFVGAQADDLIFTRNATEGINLVAYAFSNATAKSAHGGVLPEGGDRFVLTPGDEIVVTEMEHHANLVPWQEVCAKTGAVLRWIPITDEGRLDTAALDSVIGPRTKVVAFTHQSNLLGTINDVDTVARAARSVGAMVVLDSCQSIPHQRVDIPTLDVDAVAWSGHKMLGPTGIGCLWLRPSIARAMSPFITGGSMIETVTMSESTFADPPTRFEAGVPMVAQAVGLAAACDYLDSVGMAQITAHEDLLTKQTLDGLAAMPGVRIIGPTDTDSRGSAVSFVVEGIHPHDLGQVLDDRGVAVRVGHHCAWPTCRRMNVPATTRVSTYLYNDESDIDTFLAALDDSRAFFGVV
jgi:cysteine desulfurase/selenocysteine lyase